MANAQERRSRFATNRSRRHKHVRDSLPRGYIVESDESEILTPAHFKSLYPSNPAAAALAEKEYIAERWKRYPGKVYDKRERPILIDSLKEHHRKIEHKRRDEFNAKWQLYLDRQEEQSRLKKRLAENKVVKENIRSCRQCNNFGMIAVDGLCGECKRNNLMNQPFVRSSNPSTAAQRRQGYQQLSRNPVHRSAIPLPRTAAHRRRKYQQFQDRVYPPVKTSPSVPLVITERQPYSFDMANLPQDLESFPLGLPEQEVNYHDEDWRYVVGTMEDRDKIANYFLSKSYMPVYNLEDFKDAPF